MKQTAVMFCIALLLLISSMTVYALPTERIEIDSFNIPANAAYIDLLIFMNEDDACYTELNTDNMSQYSFDFSRLSDYHDDGYISFSCHYNNIYTDMTLERIRVNDEIIARNCLTLKKFSDGYFVQDIEAMYDLLEQKRKFKIAVLDENGSIIQTSEPFDIINESGPFQNEISYDIAKNQIELEWDEHPNELSYHIRKNKNIIVIISAAILFCMPICFILKKYKKHNK